LFPALAAQVNGCKFIPREMSMPEHGVDLDVDDDVGVDDDDDNNNDDRHPAEAEDDAGSGGDGGRDDDDENDK
jgi:hypothetical protein